VTTRRLIVMRHAHAVQYAASDHDRTLTERGRQEAVAAGAYLTETGMVPDHALVSSAVRTVSTWQVVAETSGAQVDAVVDPSLFTGSPHVVLEAIRSVPAEAERVLVLGHNPTVEVLVHYLDDGSGEPAAAAALLAGFPPATLAVLDVPVAWDRLDTGAARIVDLHTAR
jgi:phosphohistidine phosphatase